MTFAEYRTHVLSDLYRITVKVGISAILRQILFGESYKYIFWMRTCRFTRTKLWMKCLIYPIARFMLRRQVYKLGISISPSTEIGRGFYIGHFGGIVINDECVIGNNCNVSHGVTLGRANRGKNRGCPIIGDNVYIGPGAKIVGSVRIGNDVAIGANCVVTEDIPDHAVVVGVPGKVISLRGAEGYINRIDYEEKLH